MFSMLLNLDDESFDLFLITFLLYIVTVLFFIYRIFMSRHIKFQLKLVYAISSIIVPFAFLIPFFRRRV